MNIKRWIKNRKVAVLCGGKSAEREISLLTGNAIIKALKESGARVAKIDTSLSFVSRLEKGNFDFAFIALHGPMGEDGTVQGVLEILGIPYNGSGVLSSAVSMDKIYSKMVFDSNRIPTPGWKTAETLEQAKKCLKTIKKWPVVIKPSNQGSAIGVSIVKRKEDFIKAAKDALVFKSPILIEDCIKGREITVGILGDKTLPVVEIVPDNEFYDFESKYKAGKSKHVIPPRISKRALMRSMEVSLSVFNALKCRSVARVDLIIDKKDKPWVLEINTIPGMTKTSLIPDAAKHSGICFNDLVLEIIRNSL